MMTKTEISAALAGVAEINYPDVVGWEWRGEPFGDNPDGLLHQLVWDRHNGGFAYATKNPAGQWVTTTCRGEMWLGADTLTKARAIAAEFIHPSEETAR